MTNTKKELDKPCGMCTQNHPLDRYPHISNDELANILSAFSLTQVHQFPQNVNPGEIPQGLDLILLIQLRLAADAAQQPAPNAGSFYKFKQQRAWRGIFEQSPIHSSFDSRMRDFNSALFQHRQDDALAGDNLDFTRSSLWPRISAPFVLDATASNSLNRVTQELVTHIPLIYREEIVEQISVAASAGVTNMMECKHLYLVIVPYDNLQQDIKDTVQKADYTGWCIISVIEGENGAPDKFLTIIAKPSS